MRCAGLIAPSSSGATEGLLLVRLSALAVVPDLGDTGEEPVGSESMGVIERRGTGMGADVEAAIGAEVLRTMADCERPRGWLAAAGVAMGALASRTEPADGDFSLTRFSAGTLKVPSVQEIGKREYQTTKQRSESCDAMQRCLKREDGVRVLNGRGPREHVITD